MTVAVPVDGAAVRLPARVERALALADRGLAVVTELPAAILLAVEMVILFAGVISRYVFHRPLVWTDELASFLFLWLAMLGATIALRRGEHMRMTALLPRLADGTRATVEMLAALAPIVFVVALLPSAIEHADSEAVIRTPYLDLSTLWRVAAMPVGLALMAIAGLLQLARLGRPRAVGGAVLGIGLLAAALWLGSPALRSLGNWNC